VLPFTKPTIGPDEINAVSEVLESGWITTGPKAQELERALAEYVGGGIGVRVFNSATSALEASLLACGVGSGDEVVVPAMSFVATANVVIRVGARPVFADVELVSRTLDVATVESVITPRTRAIMPVHFAGLAADLRAIGELATTKHLLLIEDAAQAIGSSYADARIGSSGNPVCFSFHPNKNITTIEGGAVASADPDLLQRLERIRFHGMERNAEGDMDVREWGGKMNLPDVGAALGLVQLARLDAFNRKRRLLAQAYLDRLPRDERLLLPAHAPGHSWHMFCVCLNFAALRKTRQEVMQWFRERGVLLGMHYPAIHLFSLYRRLGYREGDYPVAERIAAQTLTLPLFPAMDEADVDRVCGLFEELLGGAPV